MFNFFNKAKDEVKAVVTAVKKETPEFVKVMTLPEVVDHYVSTNEDSLDDDFTEINDRIAKNEKMIKFLRLEEKSGYDNEKTIYCDERRIIEEKNNKLKLKKVDITRQTEANKVGYQKIDLSFLSMKRPVKGRLAYHPAFSVHKYTGNGFLNCTIEVDNYGIDVSNENFVPSMAVMRHLLKVFIPNLDERKLNAGYQRINYRHRDDSRNRSVEIDCAFKGIVPSTTKEKIKKAAEETFSDKNHGIFLIKECHDWQEKEITKDPLIVGVIGDQAYLIDCFDCTPLESYVTSEFTE
jgi:hypothetical protein